MNAAAGGRQLSVWLVGPSARLDMTGSPRERNRSWFPCPGEVAEDPRAVGDPGRVHRESP